MKKYADPHAVSEHILYNLSRPEKSLPLLARLAKLPAATGFVGEIFASTADADYQESWRIAKPRPTWNFHHSLQHAALFVRTGIRTRNESVRILPVTTMRILSMSYDTDRRYLAITVHRHRSNPYAFMPIAPAMPPAASWIHRGMPLAYWFSWGRTGISAGPRTSRDNLILLFLSEPLIWLNAGDKSGVEGHYPK